MDKKGTKTFIILTIVIVVILVGTLIVKNKLSANNTANQSKTDETGQVAGANTAINTEAPDGTVIVQKDTDIILFYGATCPHCKVVEEFISKNNITRYLKFQNLEVYNNQDNSKNMMEKQELCKNLSEDDKGGVPFMYSGETCLVGSDPIINYLKEKAGI